MDDLWDPVDPEDLLHHLYRQRTRLVGVDHGADDIPGVDIDHHVRIEILALHRPGQLRYIPREHLPWGGGHQLGADPGRVPGQPPLQVYAQLLDEDTYLCSVSSMYPILGEHRQVRERRRLARHPARVRPELVATAPGQVYSWDITKLAGPVKGKYFDAYVMIDIYSRYIVGAVVHAHESGPLAVEMMKEIFGVHGVPQVVHADRGTSMTSKTVAALLSDLEVTRSHSRPKVSNDNPYSEAWFKTLKYAPT